MTVLFFRDETQEPTEEAILEALGKSALSWTTLWERMQEEHPEIEIFWRHYVDGQGWLLKASKGSKTICWIAVEAGAFRVAFHFAERLVNTVLESDLSEASKAAFRKQPPMGKLRTLSIKFGPAHGVRDVMALIELKMRLK